MKDYLEIADKARASISKFCINECKAKCCRRGQLLIMNDKELDLIVGLDKAQKYFEKGILEYSKNTKNFLLYNSEIKTCRQLDKKTNLCKEHKNTCRPQVCKDYPIFIIKGEYVMFGPTCPAVMQGLLKESEKEFFELGLKIV